MQGEHSACRTCVAKRSAECRELTRFRHELPPRIPQSTIVDQPAVADVPRQEACADRPGVAGGLEVYRIVDRRHRSPLGAIDDVVARRRERIGEEGQRRERRKCFVIQINPSIDGRGLFRPAVLQYPGCEAQVEPRGVRAHWIGDRQRVDAHARAIRRGRQLRSRAMRRRGGACPRKVGERRHVERLEFAFLLQRQRRARQAFRRSQFDDAGRRGAGNGMAEKTRVARQQVGVHASAGKRLGRQPREIAPVRIVEDVESRRDFDGYFRAGARHSCSHETMPRRQHGESD